MTELIFYNQKNVKILALYEHIYTSIKSFKTVHVTDGKNNVFSGKFNKSFIKDIPIATILENKGLKELKILNENGFTCFCLNEEIIIVNDTFFYKAVLCQQIESAPTIYYQAFFNNGMLKYTDFSQIMYGKKEILSQENNVDKSPKI